MRCAGNSAFRAQPSQDGEYGRVVPSGFSEPLQIGGQFLYQEKRGLGLDFITFHVKAAASRLKCMRQRPSLPWKAWCIR